MKHRRTKLNNILTIIIILAVVYSLVLLILGSEIVIGNPILLSILDTVPYVIIGCLTIEIIADIILWLREKKNK